ncbi:MAG: hypothetical protein DLM56_13410 [Pseudonocardiales bacterium]|nr:MAG: hypothetical protein DLM56_13410 [Pseudonocardiales bacterium]
MASSSALPDRRPTRRSRRATLFSALLGHIACLVGERRRLRRYDTQQQAVSRPCREWTLFWRDRNLRWHRDEELPPSRSVQDLLDEVGSGRNPIFWG